MLVIFQLMFCWLAWNGMATPSRETIKICCNKNHLHDLYTYLSRFISLIVFTFFINNFCLVLSFLVGLCVPCSSTTTLRFFMVTPHFFRSGATLTLTFTHVLQSYLAFEVINMSSQKPCILHTHFAQAYWMLDTL